MEWINVETELPKEGGRYLCWVKWVSDLGVSEFFWNCSYDPLNKSWLDNFTEYRVTHWCKVLKPNN